MSRPLHPMPVAQAVEGWGSARGRGSVRERARARQQTELVGARVVA